MNASSAISGLAVAVWVVVIAACNEKDDASHVEVPLSPMSPSEPPNPYSRSPSRFGVIHLHAGFNPDPRVVEGTALGEVPARSIHRRCRGWIAETPDYVLAADTAFLRLHVLGRSRDDVSLVVRKPDGSVVCNDDRNNTRDPMVRSDFPIGSTQIWVGVPREGATALYRIGFSEVKWRSSDIPLPEAH